MPEPTEQTTKPLRTWWPMALAVLLACALVFYLAGYAVCRCTGVLVHTVCVLNVDFYGRDDAIVPAGSASALGKAARTLFWPLCTAEAWGHAVSRRMGVSRSRT
jgi:hypothetical protein